MARHDQTNKPLDSPQPPHRTHTHPKQTPTHPPQFSEPLSTVGIARTVNSFVSFCSDDGGVLPRPAPPPPPPFPLRPGAVRPPCHETAIHPPRSLRAWSLCRTCGTGSQHEESVLAELSSIVLQAPREWRKELFTPLHTR